MKYSPPFFDFEIYGVKRKLPFVQIAPDKALASFCIISDTELVKAVAPHLAEKLPEDIDILMTAEAKGIILTYEISSILGKEFVVARKTKKPYMQNPTEVKVFSITTQKEQTLYLDGCDAEKIKGKTVALIDDVIATGGSVAALEQLAVSRGAKIGARAAVLAELEAVYRDDIIYLKEHYVFTPNPDGTFTPIQVEKPRGK